MYEYVNMIQDMNQTLNDNILSFWLNKMIDEEKGGFLGRIDGSDQKHPEADKGAVLNARILWTFSSAYRVTGNCAYRKAAERAKNYLLQYFYDNEFGGIYWTLDADGNPGDTKEQMYGLGFAGYVSSEYHGATGGAEALDAASRSYQTIEDHRFDKAKN